MITSRVNKALAADRARRVNADKAGGSRQGGQLMTTEFCPAEEAQWIEHELWNLNVKEFNINIKGEVTSSKPTNLSEVVRIEYKFMEQKLQGNKEWDMEGNKMKWETFPTGNSSSGNNKDNSRHQ
ncbi:hypothetical protein Tco_1174325 [Tanacetum coccineum]